MGTTARLLLPTFKIASFYSASVFEKLRLFSSSAALIRRPWSHYMDWLEGSDAESESESKSAVYKCALKLQRPTTVKFQESLFNSVSLIGVIDKPFTNCNTTNGRFGVHTLLNVNSYINAYLNFRVMLKFWNEMAEMSVQHLKPNDVIYVSGPLVSYTKMNDAGKSTYSYEVNVKEINFIAQHAPDPACQKSVKLESKVSFEEIMQKRKSRLHLWQVFFNSPDEWWDNRNSKPNPKCPDFRHKDTGETLWLNDYDPPWVKKQLLLHDSSFNKQSSRQLTNAWSHLSPLVFDDAQGTLN